MICLKKIIQFVFLFGACSSVLANNQCILIFNNQQSTLRLSSSKTDEFFNLGVNLQTLPERTRNELKKGPSFLISPQAPKFEDLMIADFKNYNIEPNQLSDFHPFKNIRSFESVLRLFEFMRGDAEYYFVGNGYYISYLMARALFDGTPLQSKIKFIAFSRPLSEMVYKKPEIINNYFSELEVENGRHKKIIVIDSVTSVENPNKHSIIMTSIAIRRYLLSKGWSYRNAIDSVVSVGMPEEAGFPQTYRTNDLESYFKKLKEIHSSNFNDAIFPYFNPKISWLQSPFIDSYAAKFGNDYYWNGKYNDLDNLNRPRGFKDIRDQLMTISPSQLHFFLLENAKKASMYIEIIKAGLQIRHQLIEEINLIVSQHIEKNS